jgi:hypothetical protein
MLPKRGAPFRKEKTANRRHAQAGTLALFVLILGIPANAFAYIDPNTGGYVFQVLFPLVSAVLAGFVFFRDKVKKLLGSFTSRISGIFK